MTFCHRLAHARVYMFGGCGEGGGASNDFFQLETDTWTWCVAFLDLRLHFAFAVAVAAPSASAGVCAVLHVVVCTADAGAARGRVTLLQEHPAHKRLRAAAAAAAHHVCCQRQRHHCRCGGRARALCVRLMPQLQADGAALLLCATFTRSTSARARGAKGRQRECRGMDGRGPCLRWPMTVCRCLCSGGTQPARCSLRISRANVRVLTLLAQMTNESRIYNTAACSWMSPPIVVRAPHPAHRRSPLRLLLCCCSRTRVTRLCCAGVAAAGVRQRLRHRARVERGRKWGNCLPLAGVWRLR